MMLLIDAQDIQSMTLAVAEEGELRFSKTLFVQPEEYLKAIDEMLDAWGVAKGAIDSVGVVTGPGSFTASRVSVSIANAIAFARSLPVVGIENPERKPLKELVRVFQEAPREDLVLPAYDRPPHITPSKN